ncbi:hypothetical protein V2J09_006605, partial [Rumex salicifolius]
GTYLHAYIIGEEIYAKVNPLATTVSPIVSRKFGLRKVLRTLTVFLYVKGPSNADKVKLLKQRTCYLYQNMILDNLPALRFSKQNVMIIQWTGFPVGLIPPNSGDDHIVNHLKFRDLFHVYEGSGVQIIDTGEGGLVVIKKIVGFEIVPCIVKLNPDTMSKLHMYEKIKLVNCPTELEKAQFEVCYCHSLAALGWTCQSCLGEIFTLLVLETCSLGNLRSAEVIGTFLKRLERNPSSRFGYAGNRGSRTFRRW